MKKNGLFLMAIAVFCYVTSCSDDIEDHLNQWMLDNVIAFNAIKTNPEYKELISPGNEGSIYYKVLQAGSGTDTIKYTSTVTCYYKGWFIVDYPFYNIKAGNVFNQKLFDDGAPISFSMVIIYIYDESTGETYQTGGMIGGWKTALQHMVKGDKWEIWIPYQLGYGRQGNIDQNTGIIVIPGYSTLVFEIEVVGVVGIDDQ